MDDHSHDHAYLHAHGIAHSHGHVHENQKAVLNRLARAAGHLEKVRRMGYALDNEEELNGVICVGAPIFNYTGYPCGAIWISGPKDRLSAQVVQSSAECIKQVAQSISSELGYSKIKK